MKRSHFVFLFFLFILLLYLSCSKNNNGDQKELEPIDLSQIKPELLPYKLERHHSWNKNNNSYIASIDLDGDGCDELLHKNDKFPDHSQPAFIKKLGRNFKHEIDWWLPMSGQFNAPTFFDYNIDRLFRRFSCCSLGWNG